MSTDKKSDLDQLCVNTLRVLAAECVEKARSGHPGLPMGAAPMAYVLWTRFLRHNPGNPAWPDRDRFVLSAGHGSMLLYCLLHLSGYDLSLEDLLSFRQWNSRTPGHPEKGLTPGVESTTGPLGQGFANGVGMAVAERYLAACFNRPEHPIVDHFTYGIVSDGDLMEGLSYEAASLAGHLGLGRLIYLYDDNRISIEGSTALTFTENTTERFRSCGWHVQTVADGNDLTAIANAIEAARRQSERPSLIAVRTRIGFGSPNKQDTAAAHGEPLGAEELRQAKLQLGWPTEPAFFIPEEALNHFRQLLRTGAAAESSWQRLWRSYHRAYPDRAKTFSHWLKGELAPGWDEQLPQFEPDPKGMATRVASGVVLNHLAAALPNLIGGSADLAPSTKTLIAKAKDFQAGQYDGRNLRFGVREHAMGAIINGMAYHGGLIPYGATFFIFSDYMRPAIRLAALTGLKVIYVFTHDSIGLGEDGPTHQPVEQLASLRAMPNLVVIRPADANEVSQAWRWALRHPHGPVALVLTRQALPVLDRSRYASDAGLQRGAYLLRQSGAATPDVLLLASGSEVHIALAALAVLEQKGLSGRVVSMPSWELFEMQPEGYREQLLAPGVALRVAIEAGSSQGWHRYVGRQGEIIGLDRFGASAPGEQLYSHLGLAAERVVARVLDKLTKRSSQG